MREEQRYYAKFLVKYFYYLFIYGEPGAEIHFNRGAFGSSECLDELLWMVDLNSMLSGANLGRRGLLCYQLMLLCSTAKETVNNLL